MKRCISLILGLALIVSMSFSQDTILAQKERIAIIAVGDGSNQASFSSDEEGFYSPKGPMVSQKGELIFLPNKTNEKVQVFSNGSWNDYPAPKNVDLSEILNRQMTSYGGLSYNQSGFQFIVSTSDFFCYNYYHKTNEYYNYDKAYPTPFGIVQYSDKLKEGIAIILDVKKPASNFVVIDQKKLSAWLSSQPGGFSIGEDGFLYRNGLRWSAIPPKDWDGAKFLGRLKSDHMLWGVGTSGMESWFLITNSRSEIELQFSLPWRYADGKETDTSFNYGVGPWGELYCLIAPPLKFTGKMIKGGDDLVPEVEFDSSKPAELVVVRNHLKYFGRLNDGGVRLRKEPNTTSDILGTYPAKTGFRILEKGSKEETIGGQKNVWYKVRLLDGKKGWFFGAFVHNLYDGPNGKAPPWPNVPDW